MTPGASQTQALNITTCSLWMAVRPTTLLLGSFLTSVRTQKEPLQFTVKVHSKNVFHLSVFMRLYASNEESILSLF